MYHGIFTSEQDVIYYFRIDSSELEGCKILFACYGYEDCDGEAFVLYEYDGKLYEVHGSHCSCYGLEEQWEPEETTVEALDRTRGGWCVRHHEDAFNAFFDAFKQGNQ